MLDPRWFRNDLDDAARQLPPGFSLDTAAIRALDARRKAAQVRTRSCRPSATPSPGDRPRQGGGQDIQPLLDAVPTRRRAEARRPSWRRSRRLVAIALTTRTSARLRARRRDEYDNREERLGEPRVSTSRRRITSTGCGARLMDFEAAVKLTGRASWSWRPARAAASRADPVHARHAHREHGYTEAYVPYS